MYVVPAHLANGPDSLNELSELFDVEAALLMATIVGGERDAWSAEDIAKADAALEVIQQRCDQATGEVDARLAKRGYPLPMDAVQFPVLTVWARAIARYHLHPQRDRTSEDTGRIERDYRDALRALEFVAKGDLTLGAGDPLATQASDPSTVSVAGPGRMFGRNTLGGL